MPITLPTLTAAEFTARFPAANGVDYADTLLEDMACPACGYRRRFKIQFTGQCLVSSEGSEDCGDHEWDAESPCRCHACDATGTVLDFTIEGLDALLAEQAGADAG